MHSDLVSRLRASGTKNAPKTGNGVYMSICDTAADALEAQAAEIARLRDALKPFANCDYRAPSLFAMLGALGREDIERARAALQDGEAENGE